MEVAPRKTNPWHDQNPQEGQPKTKITTFNGLLNIKAHFNYYVQ